MHRTHAALQYYCITVQLSIVTFRKEEDVDLFILLILEILLCENEERIKFVSWFSIKFTFLIINELFG